MIVLVVEFILPVELPMVAKILVVETTGQSIQNEFWEKCGEGINHLGFNVDDLEKEVAKLEKRGFKVAADGKLNGVRRFAYMDTDKVGGVLFELIQQP